MKRLPTHGRTRLLGPAGAPIADGGAPVPEAEQEQPAAEAADAAARPEPAGVPRCKTCGEEIQPGDEWKLKSGEYLCSRCCLEATGQLTTAGPPAAPRVPGRRELAAMDEIGKRRRSGGA